MSWDSPYQIGSFHQAITACGISSRQITVGRTTVYANHWASSELTAWEINELQDNALNLPPMRMLIFIDLVPHSELVYDNPLLYFSPVLLLDSDYTASYSSTCKRNIAKGKKSGLRLQQISPAAYAERPQKYLAMLAETPQSGVDLNPLAFTDLVTALLEQDAADLFVVTEATGAIAAACVALKSASTANLRFTAFDRAYASVRPMNFLIDRLAAHYQATGKKMLDLSGYASSNPNDKLKGINRFKRGFTSTFAQFQIAERP